MFFPLALRGGTATKISRMLGKTPAPGDRKGLNPVSFLVWFGTWLVFLVDPIADLVISHYSPARTVLGGAGLILFAVLYLRTEWLAFRPDQLGPSRPDLRPYIALLVVGAVLMVAYPNWGVLVIYLGVATGSRLELRPAAVVLVATALFEGVRGTVAGQTLVDVAFLGFMAVVLGISMLFIRRNTLLVRELREARHEVARLAVADERLRFSRDLHDLLGHTLSVIALQSQVARRLMVRDPEAAEAALRELEHVAQGSLGSLREIVTEYRQRSLDAELRGAEEVLGAAGIALEVDAATPSLPNECDSLLAWAVREGVTNVLRHSRAQNCRIDIQRDQTTVRMQMADDGFGREVSPNASGLRGLRERMASAGGTLDAGPCPEGGFRLTVQLPLSG